MKAISFFHSARDYIDIHDKKYTVRSKQVKKTHVISLLIVFDVMTILGAVAKIQKNLTVSSICAN